MFLHLEHGNQYLHVAALGIYDPSTAPGGFVRFKDILSFFEARLDTAPVFRRRLVTVPFDLDRPYWVEDDNVDVEFHVRHIALPAPGDWRQLCIQVARIHSRPLDRSKPLWEAYVIEGLENRQAAVLTHRVDRHDAGMLQLGRGLGLARRVVDRSQPRVGIPAYLLLELESLATLRVNPLDGRGQPNLRGGACRAG